eukprot:UN3042
MEYWPHCRPLGAQCPGRGLTAGIGLRSVEKKKKIGQRGCDVQEADSGEVAPAWAPWGWVGGIASALLQPLPPMVRHAWEFVPAC